MPTTDKGAGTTGLTRPVVLRGWRAVPGWIASLAMIALTTFWTYWGIAEMYHEGWWGAWYNRLPYLAPVAICLIPTLAALRWPIAGGAVILAFGVFAAWFFDNLIVIFTVMGTIGGLFIVHGILLRRAGGSAGISSTPAAVAGVSRSVVAGVPPSHAAPWWRHHLRLLLAIGLPALTTIGISVYHLPIVLTRVDDGDRSAVLIEGNGVALVWAPEGPGWNHRHPWGGYPSWQSIALYGLAPIGFHDKPGYGRLEDGIVFATEADMAATQLCRYLSADGRQLLDTPPDIWRMPTADELVRTLVRHGKNAGCTWDGGIRVQAECEVRPDKESPLWSTDSPAIYYWTADDDGERDGQFVSFNGWVNATYKLGGNPRHSYRCVREP